MGSAGFSDSLATRVSPVEVIVIKGECPGASASCGTRTRSPDPQIKYAPGLWISFQLISCNRELRWSDDELCPFVSATAMSSLLSNVDELASMTRYASPVATCCRNPCASGTLRKSHTHRQLETSAYD